MKKRPQNETERFYQDLSIAFNYYSMALFENNLPTPILSIRANANSAGHFSADKLTSVRHKKKRLHELALNPVIFNRKTIEIFAVFVHDMSHLWQEVHGKPSRVGYHNRQWAKKMREIGLPSSLNGKPGGKITGFKMNQYIEKGGPFELATRVLLKKYKFDFYYQAPDKDAKKHDHKIKYTCPLCKKNAWEKRDLGITCTTCEVSMESDG